MNVRPIEIEESITLAGNDGADEVLIMSPGEVDNITIVAEWAATPGQITVAVTNQTGVVAFDATAWRTLFTVAGAAATSVINLDLPGNGRFAQYRLTHANDTIITYRILRYRTPSA